MNRSSSLPSLAQLTFVRKRLEAGDVWTFYFQSARPLAYRAGQHGIWLLPGLYRPHPFTLSSAPSEQLVAFTTHVRAASRFKQRLAALKPGASIYLFGPVQNFTLRPVAPAHVLLAQGIGITPFRSMLVQAKADGVTAPIELIHVQAADHTFRNETEGLAATAVYPTDTAGFEAAMTLAVTRQPGAAYYVSGSPAFIAATKTRLTELGIPRDRQLSDSFWGY